MLRPFEEDLFVSSFKDDDDGDDGTYYHYLKTTNYIILYWIFFSHLKNTLIRRSWIEGTLVLKIVVVVAVAAVIVFEQ